MLSRRRAFRGDSAIETLNAILKEEPPELSTSNPNVAPALERVVWHCLEKQPERRFQSANDIAFALESLSGVTSHSSQQTLLTVSAPVFFTADMDARTIRLAGHLRHANRGHGGARVCAFDAFATGRSADPAGADNFRKGHSSRLRNSFT